MSASSCQTHRGLYLLDNRVLVVEVFDFGGGVLVDSLLVDYSMVLIRLTQAVSSPVNLEMLAQAHIHGTAVSLGPVRKLRCLCDI